MEIAHEPFLFTSCGLTPLLRSLDRFSDASQIVNQNRSHAFSMESFLFMSHSRNLCTIYTCDKIYYLLKLSSR